MTAKRIREILDSVAAGRISADAAFKDFRDLPFQDLGFAKLDRHRSLRRGVPEVIYGEGKTAEQLSIIGKRIANSGANLIITRLSAEKSNAIKRKLRGFEYHADARVGALIKDRVEPWGHGAIMIVSAGTSDLAVAEEASLCAEMFGNRVERVYDVGVAGLHRLT